MKYVQAFSVMYRCTFHVMSEMYSQNQQQRSKIKHNSRTIAFKLKMHLDIAHFKELLTSWNDSQTTIVLTRRHLF